MATAKLPGTGRLLEFVTRVALVLVPIIIAGGGFLAGQVYANNREIAKIQENRFTDVDAAKQKADVMASVSAVSERIAILPHTDSIDRLAEEIHGLAKQVARLEVRMERFGK